MEINWNGIQRKKLWMWIYIRKVIIIESKMIRVVMKEGKGSCLYWSVSEATGKVQKIMGFWWISISKNYRQRNTIIKINNEVCCLPLHIIYTWEGIPLTNKDLSFSYPANVIKKFDVNFNGCYLLWGKVYFANV